MKNNPDCTPLEEDIIALLKKRGKTFQNITELANELDRGPSAVQTAVRELQNRGYNIVEHDGLRMEPVAPTRIDRPTVALNTREYSGDWVRFGVCGDKHYGNMHSRHDVVEVLYDIYADSGITTVYDTGNWIDGEAKFNAHELTVRGLDAQIDYWIEKHPQRKGITTYFIAGDDHEGWYQQRECIEIGRYAQMRAEKAGRNDLVYLGYLEATVELKAKRGTRHMIVSHPGGGAAYAISYKGQKYVESLQGGEKPAIVLQGHYHKFNLSYPREVWVVDAGCCCDQTTFMRKRQLQAHVGGCVVEFMQADDGRILRFRSEFLPFYDRKFYDRRFK